MSCMNFLKAFTKAAKEPQHISGRARRGVFGGKDKRFGNNVSFSNRKTRRHWKPNTHWKRLYSETLDRPVRLHVTTYALRCIDKAGGLDNYLLKSPDWKIGTSGVKTREEILALLNPEENVESIEEMQQ